MKIAVVGSGLAGLAAAWRLSERHEVTLFERHPSPGMAVHGVEVGSGPSACRVDVPLRVFYPGYYPRLTALYRDLGVETEPVDYSATFTDEAGAPFFGYRNLHLGPLALPLPKRETLSSRRALAIVRDLFRLRRRGARGARSVKARTIGALLAEEGYSDDFRDGFLFPTFGTICTCSYASVATFPAAHVVDYLARGVLVTSVRRAKLGADDVVRRLVRRIAHVRCGVELTHVDASRDRVEVEVDGAHERFDHVVLATKFTLNMSPGNPNAGGNGRKNIMQSCEASLRRLQTDSIDLYWMHMHDGLTPVEEVMSALDALVRSGKVRYVGLSDIPAWYAAKAQTIADFRGWAPLIAMQLEYSLITRDIEREHVPLALEAGMGITPWSPLGGGMLTGKYTREGVVTAPKGTKGAGRLSFNKSAKSPRLSNERNWEIVDALLGVAKEMGRAPAEIALNWITKRPGVTSTIIGATTSAQLRQNLTALEFDIPDELSAKLDAASAFKLGFPYEFLVPGSNVSKMVAGGTSVRPTPPWFRGK